MSDDYDSKKRRNSKGRNNTNHNNYKSGKGVKVYFEVKQDSRTYDSEKSYDRNDGGYQQRSNNNNQNRHDNNYYKNNNNQHNKSSKQNQQQQVYKKKDDTNDRYDQDRNFEQDFPPMGTNSQSYGKDYQQYSNNNNRNYNMQYENYSNSGNKTGFSNNNQKNYGNNYTEKESRQFVRWDEGGSEDILETIDMKSVDAELRGKKSGGEKPKSGGEAKTIDYNALLLAEKDEKPIEWDGGEEEGEFSNVDLMFEKKLKSNLVAYDENDLDGDLLAPQGGKSDKFNANNDEDEEPEWGDVDVTEIKKTNETMGSGVYFKGNDSQKSSQSLSSTFDSSYSTNSSRFEKVFGMGQNDEFLSNDPRVSQLKPQQQMQQLTLEQQQEYFRQMQMQQMKMSGNNMQFMQTNNPMMQMNDMNRMAMNAGNKPTQQNQMFNPYLFYQQQQILQHQQINAMQTQHILSQTQNKQGQPPNLTKTTPIKVFEKFSGQNYSKKLWYYIDRSGKRQGPFSGEEMDEWYKGGFLPGDLVITFGENNGFRQLQELVKKVEESMPKPQSNTPAPSFKQLNPHMPNLANLTSFQLCELMKNPDFIQNAQKAGYDLNRVMYSLLEREQAEKQNKTTRTSTAVITGTFDSQGVYYPVNNPEYTMRYLSSQSPTKDGSNNADDQQSSQANDSEYAKQGMQQQMQYQSPNQGQNQEQSNGSAPSDQLTSQLKSLLGVDGGLGDLLGGGSNSNKADQGKGANLNSFDFPSLSEANK